MNQATEMTIGKFSIRKYDNKTAKSIHINSNMYKKLQNLPMLEVQDGVLCGGCIEP
jgi:hypothetical protein